MAAREIRTRDLDLGGFRAYNPAAPINPTDLARLQDVRITRDSVNTTGATLAALDTTGMTDGTTAWVSTVRQIFDLVTSTATVDHITVEAALNNSGKRWIRRIRPEPSWWGVTSWKVDAANLSGIASDEANGDPSAPLRSWAELGRRLYCPVFPTTSVTVQFTDTPINDPFVLEMPSSAAAFTIFNLVGITTQIDTGTISTPRNPAISANDHFEITDATKTFTPWLQKYLLHRTNGSQPCWFWPYSDRGSGKLQISLPVSTAQSLRVLADGDTYEALKLADFAQARVKGGDGRVVVQVSLARVLGTGVAFWTTFGPVTYDRCLLDSPHPALFGTTDAVVALNNVCLPATAGGLSISGRWSSIAGLYCGDGLTTAITCGEGYSLGGSTANTMTLGGCSINLAHEGRFDKLGAMIYDWTAPSTGAIQATHRSHAPLLENIGGERNTGVLVAVDTFSIVASATNFAGWTSAITTLGTPYNVGGTLYAPSDLGIATNLISTAGLGIITQAGAALAGDLSGPPLRPSVVAIHESGGAQLTIGSISAGQALVRSGTTIIGAAGVAPSGSAGGDLTGTYPNPTLVAAGPGAGAIGGGGLVIASIQLDAKGRVLAATTASAGGTSFYQTVDAAGTPLTQRGTLNFASAFSVTDNSGASRTDVDLAAVGPGSGTIGGNGIASITLDAKGRVTAASTATYILSGASAGGDLTGTYPNPTIAANAVSDSKLRAGAAISVIGRSAGTSGNVADIAASTNGDVLRVASGVLGFGAIPEASVTGLVSDLAAKVPTSRQVIAGTGLAGGGALSSDVTVSMPSVGPGAGTVGGSGIASVTLDAQGRVTAAATATYLTSAFYQHITSGGSARTQRNEIDFDGTLLVTDDGANNRTVVGLTDVGPGAGSFGGSGIAGLSLDVNGRVTSVSTATFLDTTTAAGTYVPLARTLTGSGAIKIAADNSAHDLSANRTISISDFVASGASHAAGQVPDPGSTAGTTRFLREDASWTTVVDGWNFAAYLGPTSSTMNNTWLQPSGSTDPSEIDFSPPGCTTSKVVIALNIMANGFPAGQTLTFAIMKNGSATACTITIGSTDSGSVRSAIQSVTVTDGTDVVGVKLTSTLASGAATSMRVGVTVRFFN